MPTNRRTSGGVAEKIAPDILLEHLPKGWVISLRHDIAKALEEFAEERHKETMDYWDKKAEQWIKEARAEGAADMLKRCIHEASIQNCCGMRLAKNLAAIPLLPSEGEGE